MRPHLTVQPNYVTGEETTSNHKAITAIDWNGGASPLDAWLNQSAIPSSTIPESHPPNDDDQNSISREVEEIDVFRSVHIAMAPVPGNEQAVDEFEALELGAQIYYRNIRDRYVLLPKWLAHRLAQANHQRSERLRYERLRPKNPVTPIMNHPQPSTASPHQLRKTVTMLDRQVGHASASTSAAEEGNQRTMTIQAERNFPSMPPDVQAKCNVAIEKRKRNATAARRKKEEREHTRMIENLSRRISELKEMKCARTIEDYVCISSERLAPGPQGDNGEHVESSRPIQLQDSQELPRKFSTSEVLYPESDVEPYTYTASASHRFCERRMKRDRKNTRHIKTLEQHIQMLEKEMQDDEWVQNRASTSECPFLPLLPKRTTALVDELIRHIFSIAGNTPTGSIPSGKEESNPRLFPNLPSSQTMGNNELIEIRKSSVCTTTDPSSRSLFHKSVLPAPSSNKIDSNALELAYQLRDQSPSTPMLHPQLTPPLVNAYPNFTPAIHDSDVFPASDNPTDGNDLVPMTCAHCGRAFGSLNRDRLALCYLCELRQINVSSP